MYFVHACHTLTTSLCDIYLMQVYKLVDGEEGVKLVDFLADKVLEYVSTPNGTNLSYRYDMFGTSVQLLGFCY